MRAVGKVLAPPKESLAQTSLRNHRAAYAPRSPLSTLHSPLAAYCLLPTAYYSP